jgi:hypothetical protein
MRPGWIWITKVRGNHAIWAHFVLLPKRYKPVEEVLFFLILGHYRSSKRRNQAGCNLKASSKVLWKQTLTLASTQAGAGNNSTTPNAASTKQGNPFCAIHKAFFNGIKNPVWQRIKIKITDKYPQTFKYKFPSGIPARCFVVVYGVVMHRMNGAWEPTCIRK